MHWINPAIRNAITKVRRPSYPVTRNTIVKAIIVLDMNFILLFMARTKGELRPSQAALPKCACSTITYLAITSEVNKNERIVVPSRIDDRVVKIPIKYKIKAVA